MMTVVTLVLRTVALNYEYAFTVPHPRATNPGYEHRVAIQHNPHCDPRPI
jgi:hypothetical protein